MSFPVRARVDGQRGFSLPEMLVVMAVVAILSGVAVGVTPTIIASVRGESGMRQVAKLLTNARETAITRRRNVEVRFQPPSTLQTAEVDVPGPGTTVLDTVPFEGGVEYYLTPSLPNPPGSAGNGAAIFINSAAPNPVMFTTEGSFVDANGDPVNVSLFFAVNQEPGTATALTISGVTAVVRAWRWDGAHWVE